MSRIQALDEITRQLGPPALLRWVEAPYGAVAAVIRLRHCGAVVHLNASEIFRLIFHLSSSEVRRDGPEGGRSGEGMPAGSIITSFTERPERIRVVGAADTLHLLFSPELAAACESTDGGRLTPARRELQASAAQILVAASMDGTDTRLRQVAGSLAKLVVDGCKPRHASAGGLAPQARHVIVELLEKRISDGISVPELAAVAHLSLHHFIKVCRQSEGLTPHALLIQKRIERSIKWLLDSSISVDEIALQAGFSSPSHFISVFRRLVGVTPATLRRAARH